MPHAPLHRQPAYRLYRTARLLRAHLLEFLADTGLTPEQFFVLQRIGPEGSPQGELGDPALDDRGTVSRQVASLQERGLVARRPHPEDARVVVVTLTAAGEGAVAALEPRLAEERRRLFAPLGEADRAALDRILDQIDAALER